MANVISVLATLAFLRVTGNKPTIIRTNKYKDRGWSVRRTAGGNFLEVNSGLKVRYFNNPFHNLYRITSRFGTPDFTIKAVR